MSNVPKDEKPGFLGSVAHGFMEAHELTRTLVGSVTSTLVLSLNILTELLDLLRPDYFKKSLYEMSNFGSNTTGLKSGTKLFVRTEPKGLPHSKYRIKIEHPQHGSAVFALWGDEPKQIAGNWKMAGEDLKQVVRLINMTHEAIRNHIDGILDSAELTDVFRNTK